MYQLHELFNLSKSVAELVNDTGRLACMLHVIEHPALQTQQMTG